MNLKSDVVNANLAAGLVDPGICTSCLACVDACPKSAICVAEDDEGFWAPKVSPQACVNCGACARVCPAADSNAEMNKNEPPQNVYAAVHKDKSVLGDSTSGGAFTCIAQIFCEENYSIFGVKFDSALNLKYAEINSLDDIGKIRGSKYVQADASTVYNRVLQRLKEGRKVLFCGNPCFVSAVKSFTRGKNENLLLVDFLCGGNASQLVLKKFAESLSVKYGKPVADIKFRQRKCIFFMWTALNMAVIFKDGTKKFLGKCGYIRAFLGHLFTKKACYACKYIGEKRVGDITIADFWGVGDYSKRFNDRKGCSLIMPNSKKGADVCRRISEKMIAEELPVDCAKPKNATLRHFISRPENRDIFLSEIKEYGFERACRDCLKTPPVWKRIIAFITRPLPYRLRCKILDSI